jgi:glycosyltransferase involved in cell wall biosynthesis
MLDGFDLTCFNQLENYLLLQPVLPTGRPWVVHLQSNAFQYDHDPYDEFSRDADYWFVMTDPAQREDIGDRFGTRAHFEYVPFGMDFTAVTNAYRPARTNPPRIGVFIRLSPQRPLEPLLYCFHALRRRMDATLHLYGGGDPRPFQRTLGMLHLDSAVRFMGHAPDLERAVRDDGLTMAWMTSHDAVLGYASIELAALGVPMITWNVGTGTYEDILARTDGALHAFSDVPDFVERCRTLLGDASSLQRLGVTTARLEGYYRQVLGAASPQSAVLA